MYIKSLAEAIVALICFRGFDVSEVSKASDVFEDLEVAEVYPSCSSGMGVRRCHITQSLFKWWREG